MVTGLQVDTGTSARTGGPTLVPLGLVFLCVGLATAVSGPFVSLFLSTAVHAGPVRISAFLIAGPVSMVVSSTLLGRLSDRRPIRHRLLLGGAVAGMLGSALTAFVRDYWVLLGLAVTLTAISGAMFPQAFAYARVVLQRRGSTRAAMAISTLRMLFSIAWVAGPPLAALLLQWGGFPALYLTSAAVFAVAALVVLGRLDEAGSAATAQASGSAADVPTPGDAPRAQVLLAAAAITLLQGAAVLGVQAMALLMEHVLHAGVRDAGLVLGLCAALEIPLMLAFGALSARFPLRPLIVAGAAAGALYYGLVTVSAASWQVAALQPLNACFIAAFSGLGISYVQELLPSQPGRAATLAGNAYPVAAILAGPMFGLAQHFGYRYAYAAGALLCVAGLSLLASTGRRRAGQAG